MQGLVQCLGAVAGLLIVRHLSKADYALFTIANSMQGAMGVLADSGISVALAAIGGRVWQDPVRFGQLISAARKTRLALASCVAAIILPVLIWTLLHNQATVFYSLLLSGLVLTGFLFRLDLDVFVTVPRLHSEIGRLQSLDLGGAGLRLLMLLSSVAVYLDAAVAVGVASVSNGLQRWRVAGWAREHLAPGAEINPADQREIGEKIRHLLPSALFYCLQGQIIIFLLSLSGHSGQVADIGALGRLTILLSVFAPVMSGVILPAFSRCDSRPVLLRRYLLVLGAYLALGAGLLLFSITFSRPLLWLLGSKYTHLGGLLTLMILNAALGMVTDAMWSMNAAKGWVRHAWLEIPLRLLLQAALAFAFDITTPAGVLWFSICSQFSPILVNFLLTVRGLRAQPAD